jgi:hypothetical protein
MTDINTFLKNYKDKSFNIVFKNNDLRDFFVNIVPLLYGISINKNSEYTVTDDISTKGFYVNYEKGVVEENKETIDKDLLLYPLKLFQLLTK